MVIKDFLIKCQKLLPVSSLHGSLSLQPAHELFLILAAGRKMIESSQILLQITLQSLCSVRCDAVLCQKALQILIWIKHIRILPILVHAAMPEGSADFHCLPGGQKPAGQYSHLPLQHFLQMLYLHASLVNSQGVIGMIKPILSLIAANCPGYHPLNQPIKFF